MAQLLGKLLSIFRRGEKKSASADDGFQDRPRLESNSEAENFPLSAAEPSEDEMRGSEKERLRRMQAEKHACRRAKRERRKYLHLNSPLPPARRKIPRIADDQELVRYFLQEKAPGSKPRGEKIDMEAEIQKFPELLEESLKDADMAAVLAEKKAGGIPERRMTLNERIAAYPGPIEELDLHGFSGMEAAQMIEPFIQTCVGRKVQTVRIIPGKGLHSESDAVLPRVVERELTRLKGPGKILTFRWEKGSRRKSGSVIVYLD